jgi:UDP-N-acetylmuramoyl-tripeptide--D-alanyl-D-alanine ligase
MTFTAAAIARIVSGRLQGSPEASCTGFWTDSRGIRPGEAFIALVSETGDGHHYVPDLLRGGTPIAVVSRPVNPDQLPAGAAAVVVEESWEALAAIASEIRGSLPVTVAAITGTNGKTGVKELTARLLNPATSCRTERNYNNLLGIAWTLFRLPSGCKTLVAEIGMNHRGEIDRLARILSPILGVITAARPVHLEHLGSLREVAEAKAELIPHLPPEGTLVANGDDPRVRSITGRASCPVVFCGTGPGCDVTPRNLALAPDGRWSFGLDELPGATLTTPLPGRFWVVNSLLAFAAARSLGVSAGEILSRWPSALPLEHRLSIRPLADGTLLIDDAYNASPASVREAVTLLGDLPLSRRYALLGGMAELGEPGEAIHRHLGTWIARKSDVTVVGVGPLGALIGRSAAEAAPGRGFDFATIDEAVGFLRGVAGPGVGILVKGSRETRMERAVDALSLATTEGRG